MAIRVVLGLAAVATALTAPAALAFPIQPSTTAPETTLEGQSGPRRPGLIPSTSSAASMGADVQGGQHRPVPSSITSTAQTGTTQTGDTLSAEK